MRLLCLAFVGGCVTAVPPEVNHADTAADTGSPDDSGDTNDTSDTTDSGEGGDTGDSADTGGAVDTAELDADADGYTPNAGDCDDANPAINPGATETLDGIDNNCDRAGNRIASGTLDAIASARITGKGPTALGISVDGAGDVDGDGFDDVVLGNMGDDSSKAGAIYMMRGPFSGDVSASTAELRLVSESGSDGAGYCVAGIGDFDGDELGDLAVGAYANSLHGYGSAYVSLGTARGKLGLGSVEARIYNDYSGAASVYTVGPGGDVDGDGRTSILVGTTGAAAGFRIDGGSTGELRTSDDASTTWTISDESAGFPAVDVLDINGDGVDEVFFGASYVDAGTEWLVDGAVTGSVDITDAAIASWTGESAGDDGGRGAIGPGDVDGDGANDLVISAPANAHGGAGAGAIYLFLGPTPYGGSLGEAEAIRYGETGEWAGGNYIAGPNLDGGDLDSDGRADVVVGGLGTKIRLLYGPFSGSDSFSAADATLTADAGTAAGQGVAVAGDVDGDGFLDVIVGGDGANGGLGLVWVVLSPGF